MNKLKAIVSPVFSYLLTFGKWVLIACGVGAAGGVVGSVFYKGVVLATGIREAHSWIIALLPVGGLAIAGIYRLCRLSGSFGTNQILDSVRTDRKIPLLLAPVIFVSTIITHLLGGSVGREGAALQLGGTIGETAGRICRLDERDMHLAVLCGMSGVFSALFGTPVTAAFFAIGVVSIGIMHYSSLVPCLTSAFTAYGISRLFGVAPTRFTLSGVPAVSVLSVLQVALLAALCAAVSILFCVLLRRTEKLFARFLTNPFLRIFAGGAVVAALSFSIGTFDYNGAGVPVITAALSGSARPWDFLLKIAFTVLSIGCGYKGGEIVPTFFIGATFGCVAGGLLGLNPAFGAAVGLVALFCASVNCPVASIFLSIELFGAQGLLFFAAACGVSYVLSGYYGLYSGQRIVYSKLRAEYININAR